MVHYILSLKILLEIVVQLNDNFVENLCKEKLILVKYVVE